MTSKVVIDIFQSRRELDSELLLRKNSGTYSQALTHRLSGHLVRNRDSAALAHAI